MFSAVWISLSGYSFHKSPIRAVSNRQDAHVRTPPGRGTQGIEKTKTKEKDERKKNS